jgi:hypothetical protein
VEQEKVARQPVGKREAGGRSREGHALPQGNARTTCCLAAKC